MTTTERINEIILFVIFIGVPPEYFSVFTEKLNFIHLNMQRIHRQQEESHLL